MVAALGQWLFAFYVLAVFGPMLLQDGIEGLKEAHLFNGFIPGDTVGNYAVAGHIMLAVVIMGAGPLQLIPQIRARFPVFHHWTGRSYILAAVTSSIAGLYLIWTRPIFGDLVNNISTSFSGVLVIAFAAIALRYAMARDIRNHRRWALRLFMVASASGSCASGRACGCFSPAASESTPRRLPGRLSSRRISANSCCPLQSSSSIFAPATVTARTPGWRWRAGLAVLTILMGIGIFLVATNSWFQRI